MSVDGLERIFYEVLSNPACNETFDSLNSGGIDLMLSYYEMFQAKEAYKIAVEMDKSDMIERQNKKYK